MSRWRLERRDPDVARDMVHLYVLSPEYGEVKVGTLFLSEEDQAELTELLNDRSA